MSNYKLTETQFVAIYKLKFYKNKKNWKLYEDVKKEPPQPPPSPTKLNKTYDVRVYPEQDYDMEQVSAHNMAFLHEEPEDAPDAPLLDCEPTSLPVPPHPLYRPRSWPNQVWGGEWTQPPWQGPQQEWCGVDAEGVRDELAYDQCDGPLTRDNVWTPAPHLDLNPPADPLDPRAEYLTLAQVEQSAQEWITSHGYSTSQEHCTNAFEEYGLLDDSDDFVRGAHLAPHSSEIDLSVTQECACACTCKSPCSLSAGQLSRAIQRHRAALSLLLDELDLRGGLTSRSLHHPPLPRECQPSGIPPGVPPGVPTGPPLGMPPGVPTGPPLGMPPGVPTGPPLGMPPGVPTGPPLGMPPGPGTLPGRGRGRLHSQLRGQTLGVRL